MESSRNSAATYMYRFIWLIFQVYMAQVFESIRISGNSYWYLRNEKKIEKEDNKIIK